jgi:hypothetical protein
MQQEVVVFVNDVMTATQKNTVYQVPHGDKKIPLDTFF